MPAKEAASNKAEDIMDVNPDAVANTMQEHQVKRLIHGHTHRPCRHTMPDAERVVLGDWNTTGWYLLERDGRSSWWNSTSRKIFSILSLPLQYAAVEANFAVSGPR